MNLGSPGIQAEPAWQLAGERDHSATRHRKRFAERGQLRVGQPVELGADADRSLRKAASRALPWARSFTTTRGPRGAGRAATRRTTRRPGSASAAVYGRTQQEARARLIDALAARQAVKGATPISIASDALSSLAAVIDVPGPPIGFSVLEQADFEVRDERKATPEPADVLNCL